MLCPHREARPVSRTGHRRGTRVSTEETFKHSSDVIFPSTLRSVLRATLNASCSLVSLAVQSLRSM
ncbi:hypothetical protein C5L38_14120 [Streptomyces sp. WAC00288]|nr:hypothetical protein C5L38_14120 [Streptomyces sp. WAC00288]